MKTIYFLIMASAMLLVSCQSKEEAPVLDEVQSTTTERKTVTVTEVLDTPNYSYLNVKDDKSAFWIAVPRMNAEVGQTLYFSKSMTMKNFRSETLGRTFDEVLFVEDISDKKIVLDENFVHPEIKTSEKESVNITPVSGGYTVEQVHLKKESLAGKKVKVKGKVTKYNSGILGRNWIHIQDGSGKDGTHDLVVTSNQQTKPGDIIIAEGIVAVNKDFGSGYVYNVIVESADIKTEKEL